MVRLSIERPVTASGSAPHRRRASPPPSPSTSIAAPRSCDPRRKRGRHRIVIAERQGAVADDLPGLVALAGDQQRIARLQRRYRGADRLGAVADFAGASRGCRIAARIASGFSLRGLSSVTMTLIGIFSGDRAHQRPLAGIAVAAGAEHHDELASGIGPQRLQRLGERVGLVGVSTKIGAPLRSATRSSLPLAPSRSSSSANTALGSLPVPIARPGRHQRILDLEFADQRQPHRMSVARDVPASSLCAKPSIRPDQTNALACAVAVAADRDDAQFSARAASITVCEQS